MEMEPPAVKTRGADDLISGLPDELLHIILLHLPTVAAAARTSVLSRHWRRVWTYLPELDFRGSPAPGTTSSGSLTTLLDSIDATINCYSAPTLCRLKIDVSDEKTNRCDISAHRVARWLRFASERLTGKLCIHLPYRDQEDAREEELLLPVCERASEIDIYMGGPNFILRLPPTGSFAALTDLAIVSIEVDGGELGRVVSTQCPCLQKLCLLYIGFVGDASTLSIRSESLECLQYCAGGVNKCKLEVTAPMLLQISVRRAGEAYIVAPKLEKLNGEVAIILASTNLLWHRAIFGRFVSCTQLGFPFLYHPRG